MVPRPSTPHGDRMRATTLPVKGFRDLDARRTAVDDLSVRCCTGSVDILRLVIRGHIDFGRVWSSSCPL